MGSQLKSIDLFCGAGGLTEGFRQAKFKCLYGNDINEIALQTFKHNHPHAKVDDRGVAIDPHEIRSELGLRVGELDALCGGPPCQGFSINAPERFLEDPRNKLFKNYIAFLKEFQPKTFVMENVPGMLSLGNGRIFEKIITEFKKLDYAISLKILFAAHYGIPQERWRLILLGSTSGAIQHPEPTHYATGVANFTGSREHTFKLLDFDRYQLKPYITVHEAIGDLPRLRMGEGSDDEVCYTKTAHSEYALEMRGKATHTFNHFASVLSEINVKRLEHIKPGGSWRDIPFELLPKGMQRARRSDHTRRYGRLLPKGLAGTVMTKCDPHWGSVFLPDQDRALTVREAARIQSFPDSYRFLGPRTSQYEQVGNAVPCLLAKAIATVIKRHLKNADALEPMEALSAR